MVTPKKRFATIDEYISACPLTVQEVLGNIRWAIRGVAPTAEESISYQMPTFNLNGKHLVHFSAWKKHIGMYPVPSGDEAFQKEIAPYLRAKSTARFPLDAPIPYELLEKLVRFRIRESEGHAG
ncbi:MAG: iron chaperone [Chloroflexota bacterium]